LEPAPTIRSEIGPTLKLAVPIMLGMLGYGLMFYVDVAMAGHLGETALAASALASNLSYIPYVFGIGVVGAVAVYQSQDNGAGVEESAPAILRHGMALALALGVVTAVLSHALVGYLPLLGSTPEVTAEAHDFFILMSWSMIPGLLFHALRGHRDSQHQPWISLVWLSVGILANILLNWLWMFGHWGFPAMGLAGAGWATLVARCVMFIGLWFTPGRGAVRWMDGLQLAVFRRLLQTGWPAGLHSLSEVGIFAVVPIMAGWLSSTAQAAHQVAISTASAAFMLPLGLGIAAGIRVGEAYGAKDPRRVQAIGHGALILGGPALVDAGLWRGRDRDRHGRLGLAGLRGALGSLRRVAGRGGLSASLRQLRGLGFVERFRGLLAFLPAVLLGLGFSAWLHALRRSRGLVRSRSIGHLDFLGDRLDARGPRDDLEVPTGCSLRGGRLSRHPFATGSR